jgi:RimJ/RimL family protein N-acetyltransferase
LSVQAEPAPAFEPFAARPLEPSDHAEAFELCKACGAHGVYVFNDLAREHAPRDRPGLIAFHGREALLGLAYCGRRGNLVVVERAPLDGSRTAAAIAETGWSWRIVLGSAAVVAALAGREGTAPAVHREQLYYGMLPPCAAPAPLGRAGEPADLAVRHATRADAAALMEASLELNRVDLAIDPLRVRTGWLKQAVLQRIREGTTFVIGPLGAPLCKLDVGSRGPAGIVLEGVFTQPDARGRGLATRLVAAVSASLGAGCPLVCLHVDAANAPAQRAYAKAGMRRLASCRLLLRG